MGIYRFILAILVLINHTGLNTFNFATGPFAVINFLIISGYLNTYLIENHYSYNKKISSYYLDRFLRIAPQFYFYFFLAIFLNFYFKVIEFNFLNVLLEFPIITQGYYFLFDNIFGTNIYNTLKINPPVWSLGLELTFYIVIPFVIIYFKNYIKYFFLFSLILFLIVFIFSYRNDALGFRLLPGTFFTFLIGSYLYYSKKGIRKIVLFTLVIFIILFIITYSNINSIYYKTIYNKEVISAVIVGTLTLNYIKKKKSNKIDIFFGNLCYGIFLNHFFIILIFKKYFTLSYNNIILIILLSMILSYISFTFIENNVSKIRKKIRYRNLNDK